MHDDRPSPEEMLARARLESTDRHRGRLKVFLGAAPGVGKTYAMLESAQARRREGVDVVAGWVETHGRAETERLLEGLQRLPPRRLEYRGLTLQEFDLDAALERRPQLLLVDELPHTNASGSRHERRWQDIDELLERGISVDTTLNIQHVESLNDVVALLTGVEVSETIPDRLLDQADEIELIDLPPEELLQRLREGKVYVPTQAARAMENFFTPRNLTALRELVLRRAADRISAERRGLPEAPGAADSMLVVVGPGHESADLIRATYRTASRLRAHWIALSVETPLFERMSATDRERLAAHLALAQRLGGETLVVRGERLVDEIVNAARSRAIARIIVGAPSRPGWLDRLRGSLADRLIRAGAADVVVLKTRGEEAASPEPGEAPPRARTPITQYGRALIAVAAATGICWPTRSILMLADQAMVYLLAVLLVAGTLNRGPSLFAAVASVAALDFFFVPPYFTFSVHDARHVLTFIVVLVTAILVSRQTHLIREQGEAARRRERGSVALYYMTRDFAAARTAQEIVTSTEQNVGQLLGRLARLQLAGADGRFNNPPAGEGPPFNDRDLAVARWVLERGQPAGAGTTTLPGSDWLFLPIRAEAPPGVLAIRSVPGTASLTPAESQIVAGALGQVAVALERIHGSEAAEGLRIAVETEKARNTLLSLVSHDLRTPLASIAGSAESILAGESMARLSQGERTALLESIRDEAHRLGTLVGDLLELTRLESATLPIRKERCPLEELIASARDQAESLLPGRRLTVTMPEEMVFLDGDPVLLARVIVNLLDNAGKYTPPGTPIELTAEADAARVELTVSDHGPGLNPGEETRVFEMFHRSGNSSTPGTGLGLALSAAIVRAHGGRVHAANRPGGGASFTIEIPRAEAPSLAGLPEVRV